MLLKFNHGCWNAIYDIVTGDGTCIYCYIPKRKQQSSAWVIEGQQTVKTEVGEKRRQTNDSVLYKTGPVYMMSLE